MGFEIDFLPVGSGERSGDAIALRYRSGNNYCIHVIDGGDLESGTHMVEHIKDYYGNPAKIDALICTHGDADHSSGLRNIIENFQVGGIWMNRPWNYVNDVVISGQSITLNSLKKRLRRKFSIPNEIENLAIHHKIPLHDCFQGTSIGSFCILSPSKERYIRLIPQFLGLDLGERLKLSKYTDSANATQNFVHESCYEETLQENVVTSASNESSIVQIAQFAEESILLTGDAGVLSLNEAANYAETFMGGLPKLDLIQIPHHGSRHNVSPSILNKWIGEIGYSSNTCAIASVAEKTITHPKPQVVNALIRRGCEVFSTHGNTLNYSIQMPHRHGWSSATPHQFMEIFPE
ncbi:MAG: MBL fold metallo-hydrolase [Bacteroidetes bacterium]|nr:MBL fold metallo-hydrolase [Bacteroidota bacterium]